MEIKIKDEVLNVQLQEFNGNHVKITVDGRLYDIDLALVESGVYSLLHGNRSYNVELIKGSASKKYTVNTQYRTYDVEIIDAQAKYKENRNKSDGIGGAGTVASPMPGRVIKLLVKKGDKVTAGQPVVIVSAMKMESEYKSGIEGVVKKILVKEGQTIEGNQTLIVIE